MLITFAQFKSLDELTQELDEAKESLLVANEAFEEASEAIEELKNSDDPDVSKLGKLKRELKSAKHAKTAAEETIQKIYCDIKRTMLADEYKEDHKFKGKSLDKKSDKQADKIIGWDDSAEQDAKSEAKRKHIDPINEESDTNTKDINDIKSKAQRNKKKSEKEIELDNYVAQYQKISKLETKLAGMSKSDPKYGDIKDDIDEAEIELIKIGKKVKKLGGNDAELDEAVRTSAQRRKTSKSAAKADLEKSTTVSQKSIENKIKSLMARINQEEIDQLKYEQDDSDRAYDAISESKKKIYGLQDKINDLYEEYTKAGGDEDSLRGKLETNADSYKNTYLKAEKDAASQKLAKGYRTKDGKKKKSQAEEIQSAVNDYAGALIDYQNREGTIKEVNKYKAIWEEVAEKYGLSRSEIKEKLADAKAEYLESYNEENKMIGDRESRDEDEEFERTFLSDLKDGSYYVVKGKLKNNRNLGKSMVYLDKNFEPTSSDLNAALFKNKEKAEAIAAEFNGKTSKLEGCTVEPFDTEGIKTGTLKGMITNVIRNGGVSSFKNTQTTNTGSFADRFVDEVQLSDDDEDIID